jgi:hypothetical protein
VKLRMKAPALTMAVVAGFAIGAWVRYRRAGESFSHNYGSCTRHMVSSTEHDRAAQEEKDKKEAIEPLNPDILRKRIGDVFSGGYLTLVAIIQGVAFGVLVAAAQHELLLRLHWTDRLVIAMEVLVVFEAIVIVTHQYFLLTEQVRWTPTILDTLVPYGLGLGEVGAAFLLRNYAYWWASFSFLVFVSAGAFVYSGARATKPVFGEMPRLHKSFQTSVRIQARICAVLTICSVAITVLSFYTTLPWWSYVAGAIVAAAGGVYIAIAGALDQDMDYGHYEIPVWRIKNRAA